MSVVQRFARNTIGRDFVVGDVHGCFGILERRLAEVAFDETRDRLFGVGDLVDRGPDSGQALDWIAKPWFHPVRGNHEQMAIGVAAGRHDIGNYLQNGGGWFLMLTGERQKLIAQVFGTLPFAIEVDTSHGRIGIVHADIDGASWDEFVASLDDASASNNKRKRIMEVCLWSRERIMDAERGQPTDPVTDLETLFVGHTPVKQPTRLGNVHYIDTGAVFGRTLTVMQIDGPEITRS